MQTMTSDWRFRLLGYGVALAVAGCQSGGGGGGGGGGQDGTVPQPLPAEGASITLKAPAVPQGEGTPTYQWTQVEGLPVELDDPTARDPSFPAPQVEEAEVLAFEVEVTTGGARLIFDVVVNVAPEAERGAEQDANRPPVVDAGPAQEVAAGAAVELDAGGTTDPDGDVLSFEWTQIFPGGDGGEPAVALPEAGSAAVSFTADTTGTYFFAVSVSDGQYQIDGITSVVVVDEPPGQGPGDSPDSPGAPECTSAAQCDDGDLCTTESCQDGACVSTPVVCAEGQACEPGTGACVAETAAADVRSTFDEDDEGWLVVGNGITRPTYNASGGRMGGYLSMTDGSSDTWYWDAPEAFLGEQSAAYGRTLEFDLGQSAGTYDRSGPDVVLEGSGLRLVFYTPSDPYGGWTHYCVPLHDSAGWLVEASGEKATEAELRAVLAELGQLMVRGEYRGSGATGSLDNVLLRRSDSVPVRTQNVASTFDVDEEDWAAIGNGSVGGSRPNWDADGGRDGGYVWVSDGSNNWHCHWDAPAKFLGDVSAAYGRALTFNLAQSGGTYDRSGPSVMLAGAGVVVHYNGLPEPYGGWTHYCLMLEESAGWRRHPSDELATEAELLAVLGNLGQIMIRAEYKGSGAQMSLDNVRLDLGSEPDVVKTQNVVSRFETEDHGWTAIGNGARGASRPTYSPDGAYPGGYVRIHDDSSWVIYWDAPPQFLGNLSNAYGRSLSFELAHTGGTYDRSGVDVALRGGGVRLYFNPPYDPHGGWTYYNIPLDASSGWRVSGSGELATEAEMRTALSAVGQWLIKGEFMGSGTTASLANVALDLGSEPLVPETADIVSTFDDEDHGWTVIGNGAYGASRPNWEADGGRPGGYAWIQDDSSWVYYWDAPDEFHGDVSAAYGRTLSFDLAQSAAVYGRSGWDVVLRGGGLTLGFDTSGSPETGWTSYSVVLDDLAG